MSLTGESFCRMCRSPVISQRKFIYLAMRKSAGQAGRRTKNLELLRLGLFVSVGGGGGDEGNGSSGLSGGRGKMITLFSQKDGL